MLESEMFLLVSLVSFLVFFNKNFLVRFNEYWHSHNRRGNFGCRKARYLEINGK